jgi:dTDP-4-dehydrorhamnose 3,5-epimerase
LFYIERPVYTDERGYFREIGRVDDVELLTGAPFRTAQLNHSHSIPNTLRGIHAEGWNKLVTAITGVAYCAFVDLRPDSPTFLRVQTLVLQGGTGAVFIPKGVGNSFLVISETNFNYVYAVDRRYDQRDPEDDKAINVYDPVLQIPWPGEQGLHILSDRDRDAVGITDLFPTRY